MLNLQWDEFFYGWPHPGPFLRGHIKGVRLEGADGVRYRHTDAGPSDHFGIIGIVTAGHYLR